MTRVHTPIAAEHGDILVSSAQEAHILQQSSTWLGDNSQRIFHMPVDEFNLNRTDIIVSADNNPEVELDARMFPTGAEVEVHYDYGLEDELVETKVLVLAGHVKTRNIHILNVVGHGSVHAVNCERVIMRDNSTAAGYDCEYVILFDSANGTFTSVETRHGQIHAVDDSLLSVSKFSSVTAGGSARVLSKGIGWLTVSGNARVSVGQQSAGLAIARDPSIEGVPHVTLRDPCEQLIVSGDAVLHAPQHVVNELPEPGNQGWLPDEGAGVPPAPTGRILSPQTHLHRSDRTLGTFSGCTGCGYDDLNQWERPGWADGNTLK